MNDIVESLTKLAEDLTARVDSLESANTQLKAQLVAANEQVKTASAKPEPAPAVSEAVVNETLDALVKCGALTEDQRDKSREILLTDMEAPHRLLRKFIDAQAQAKTASVDDNENIAGGQVVTNGQQKRDPMEECYGRMAAILGIN